MSMIRIGCADLSVSDHVIEECGSEQRIMLYALGIHDSLDCSFLRANAHAMRT